MDEETLRFEFNENWLRIMHAARWLAAERLGVDPATKPDPSPHDRALAAVLWREYLLGPQNNEPPLRPRHRDLTPEEQVFGSEWLKA